MKHFEVATLKLTALYMGLLMTLSLILSIWLFSAASREFTTVWSTEPSNGVITVNDDSRVLASSQRLLRDLIYFNLVVFGSGTLLSYALARRTLRPIQQNYRLQEEFASNASHQLRTPLTILKGELQLISQNKKATLSEYQTVVATSREEVDRLIILSERLLKLSSGPILSTGKSHVVQSVQKTIARMQPLMDQKKIVVKLDIDNVKVRINETDLAEILTIILDNTIKYSPIGGIIELQGKIQSQQVAISIKDQGPGIAPQDLPHIFERFYRAKQAPGDGYGLGLALAQKLAVEAGGSITAESRPGCTNFILYVPA